MNVKVLKDRAREKRETKASEFLVALLEEQQVEKETRALEIADRAIEIALAERRAGALEADDRAEALEREAQALRTRAGAVDVRALRLRIEWIDQELVDLEERDGQLDRAIDEALLEVRGEAFVRRLEAKRRELTDEAAALASEREEIIPKIAEGERLAVEAAAVEDQAAAERARAERLREEATRVPELRAAFARMARARLRAADEAAAAGSRPQGVSLGAPGAEVAPGVHELAPGVLATPNGLVRLHRG